MTILLFVVGLLLCVISCAVDRNPSIIRYGIVITTVMFGQHILSEAIRRVLE